MTTLQSPSVENRFEAFKVAPGALEQTNRRVFVVDRAAQAVEMAVAQVIPRIASVPGLKSFGQPATTRYETSVIPTQATAAAPANIEKVVVTAPTPEVTAPAHDPLHEQKTSAQPLANDQPAAQTSAAPYDQAAALQQAREQIRQYAA